MNNMRIERYRFGEVVVCGEVYRSDLIVYWNRVESGWWRREGHILHVEDIADVVRDKPEVVVIGTGAYGAMRVLPETEDYIRSRGIKLIVKRTEEACKVFNELAEEGRRVVAALHLTC